MAKAPPSSDRPEAETVVFPGPVRSSADADDDPTPASAESASTNDTAMPIRRYASQPSPEFAGPPRDWPARFALRRVLGHGGTGFVLAAADRDLKREVAIKILRDDAALEQGTLERFLREAEVTANLEHPNIVPVYDVETTGELTYLVMRHVRGEALGRRIRRACRDARSEVMPINDLINVFLKVCEAIAFAHHRGVLHRDIKPDNIMVGDFGEVMVVDWGAASSVGTGDGVMVGTPHYMSPEQMRGFAATPASDVYALGATLFYALLLRRPVEGEQDDAFWGKKLEGQIDLPTSEERMRVPRALLEIVLKALCPRPEDRHPSALALAAELRNYQAGRVEWSSPIVVETFADDWQTRWCPARPGQFAVEEGCLVSRDERDSRAFYRRRLTAPVAVEFEGQILPGAKGGDLSVIWTETDVLAGGEVDTAAEGRTYTLQTGAYANIRAGIFGSSSLGSRQTSVALSARPFVLEPGRTYSIRAEIDERVLRLFVDGELICEHEDLFPLRSGHLGLYAFYPGKSFRNVRISAKGMPERVSPIVVGDEFYKCDDFEKALMQYRRVADAHAGELLAEEATYKQGLCMYRLGRRTDAHRCWSSLRGPTYRGYAAIHSMDEAFEARDHGSGAAQFREIHAQAAALRPILRSNWSAYVREASNVATLRTLITLRDDVFPDDAATSDAAAGAMERSGRWQELLDRYPSERLWHAIALFALGRTNEVLERFADIPFLRDEALLRLGRVDDLEPGDDLYSAALLIRDQIEDGVRIAPDSPEMLLAASRPDLVLGRNHGSRWDASALRSLGRLEEAMALGDVVSLLYGNRMDAALERASSLEDLYVTRSYCALAAYIAGDRAVWHSSLDELSRAPFSWRWPCVWPSRYFILPLLERLDGRPDALARACHFAATETRDVHGQALWHFARLVLRQIDEATFDAQPYQFAREARKAIALALRAELEGRVSDAVAFYRSYLALPASRRLFEPDNTDPVLDRFVPWRVDALTNTT